MAGRTFSVVTCMGRLDHLTTCAPLFPPPCVVVSYSCPESAAWAREAGLISVEVDGGPVFSKPKAVNAGVRAAVRAGAESVLLLDADTVVGRGFSRWALPRIRRGHFVIAHEGDPGLVGVVGADVGDFEKAGWMDESFEGWGAEDIDMRLRLHLVAGAAFERAPRGLLSSTPHEDDLRTRNYRVKNQWVSRAVNAIRLGKNVRSWTGAGVSDLPDSAKDLMRG